jgi:hypothetical protein
VIYLRWDEEDADEIAPSLYKGRGGRGRAAKSSGEEKAAKSSGEEKAAKSSGEEEETKAGGDAEPAPPKEG